MIWSSQHQSTLLRFIHIGTRGVGSANLDNAHIGADFVHVGVPYKPIESLKLPPSVVLPHVVTIVHQARLLDPFEQLEREWEAPARDSVAQAAIRPPSAFCSLTDIQEEERGREVGELLVIGEWRGGRGGGRTVRSEGKGGRSDGKGAMSEGSGVRSEHSELDDSGVHSDLLEEEEETPAPNIRQDTGKIFSDVLVSQKTVLRQIANAFILNAGHNSSNSSNSSY